MGNDFFTYITTYTRLIPNANIGFTVLTTSRSYYTNLLFESHRYS